MEDPKKHLDDLNRRDFLKRLGALLATAGSGSVISLLTGCGGGGGASGQTPQSTPTVKQNVVPIPHDGSVTVANQNSTTLTLTGNVPALTAGNVIVSALGAGILAKVASVTVDGSTTTIQTTPATMEDVFNQGQVSLQTTLGPNDFSEMSSPLQGVTISSSPSGGLRSHGAGGNISVDLADTPITAELTVTGSVSVSFSLDHEINFDGHGVQSVRFVPSVTAGFSLDIEGTVGVEFNLRKVHYGHFVGKPITVWVDIVPVVFVPTFDLYFTMTASVGGTITVTMGMTATAGAGLAYTRGSGWQVVSVPLNPAPVFVPNAGPEVTADITPVHFEYSELIYGIVGPSLELDAPTFELQAILDPANKSVPGVEVKVSDNFNATVGFLVQVLGKTLLDKTAPGALTYTHDFFDQFYPDSNVTVN